jgi:hypothetical protein
MIVGTLTLVSTFIGLIIIIIIILYSDIVSNIRKAELLLQECRKAVALEDWKKLDEQLNNQLGLLRDDIGELHRSIEVVEQEEGRIRLGISKGEVNQRREFIKKIQSSYQTLVSDFEHEKQKRPAQSLLPRQTMPRNDPIQGFPEQDDVPFDRSFIDEHQALKEVRIDHHQNISCGRSHYRLYYHASSTSL